MFLGISIMATRDANTAPREKNTESAVTRYSLPRGICSKRRVPSVGNEPFQARCISARARGKKRNEFGKTGVPQQRSQGKTGMRKAWEMSWQMSSIRQRGR